MSSKNKLALAAGTVVALLSSAAFAADPIAGATNANDVYAWAAAAAGFAIGIAALGGTMGQGRSVAAAVEGISRNPGATPRIQTAMILGLAMIESLVLFALVIAILLWTKINVTG